EETINRASDLMNQRMYVLSLVAAVFLPLGFLTGLLGINVGGIPGVENPNAFYIFIVILGLTTGGMMWYFKHKRWL
ncbi:MAG TPA: CorA family divalent cation transporter, partial [Motiliproteus sp.]